MKASQSEPSADAGTHIPRSLDSLTSLERVLLEALKPLVEEFGGSIEQYHKIGPDWTHKDGTETLNASTLLDRELLIEAARAAIQKAEASRGGSEGPQTGAEGAARSTGMENS